MLAGSRLRRTRHEGQDLDRKRESGKGEADEVRNFEVSVRYRPILDNARALDQGATRNVPQLRSSLFSSSSLPPPAIPSTSTSILKISVGYSVGKP